MKLQNNGHKWTEKEIILLMSMWNDNKNIIEIANQFDVTPRGINKQITRMRKDGIKIPRRNAGHQADCFNKPWTQSEVEYVLRRRKELVNTETIGQELGRSFLAVQGLIQKLRKEGVKVQMLGNGARKLWNVDSINNQILAGIL